MKITIHPNECVCCGACVVVCPFHAITLDYGHATIHQERCQQCKLCICKCITRAIYVEEDGQPG